ncbi:hypothetical protein NPX13_g7973 [Xylaria arbuscula]|uniref:Pyrroline-5-carboxylate reductase n=1 Tax=Xylaria arbuscula TaxID=114810 RepID=A0A9W8N912_9PEZI|nr:hypothetical protein NPX13_g7973 [Xylaria arbuscula]
MTSQLQKSKLAFIGGGNMAAAIIGGLSAKGIDKQNICVSEPWEVNRNKMSDIGELAGAWAQRSSTPLIISIAAGITLASMREWLKLADRRVPHIVRVMPNTPALVGEGASGLYADESVSAVEKELAAALLSSVSQTAEWVDREELIDVVTGVSGKFTQSLEQQYWITKPCLTIRLPGSGPAYFFAMVEHLIDSGIKLGLTKEQATRLAKQTCMGAGKMLIESSDEPSQLRKNVTSPNGTTAAALESFEASGFKEIVDKAVKAATDRAAELGETLGKS